MLLASIFIWPFNKTLYRKIVCNLGYSIWSQFAFLGQWWSGSDCKLIIENPDDFKYLGQERAIVVMNHKYEIDWILTWILSERLAVLGCTKIYGKSSLRWVPIIGWAWHFTESIFLKRQWDKDRETLTKDLDYLKDYPKGYNVLLLLFCEGTRFTEEKHEESMAVARKKGLPELKHHLLPRTKGFVLTMRGIEDKVSSILDITCGFRKDGAEPTLMNIIKGKAVRGEFYVRRIPIAEVPVENDEVCGEWLHELYRNKDKIYDNFEKNGRFTLGTEMDIPWRYNDLATYIFWFILLCVPLFYYLGQVFMTGSLYLQFVIVGSFAIAWLVVRKMIAVTEIKKSSKYGKMSSSASLVNGENKKME